MKHLFSSLYRVVFFSLIVSVVLSFLPTTTFAATEKIQSYEVDLTLNAENTVDVIETITYDFGSTPDRHGIFRHVPVQFSDGAHPLKLTAITDETGAAYPYADESDSQNAIWKIGDPDNTITGVHTYIMRYSFEAPVGLFSEKMDRFAWNAIGTGWEVPTEASIVTLHLPETVKIQDVSEQRCFVGMAGLGIGDGCTTSVDTEKNALLYTLERRLNAGEGLTIQVDLPGAAVDDAAALAITDDLSGSTSIDGAVVESDSTLGRYIVSPKTHIIEARRPFFEAFNETVTLAPGQIHDVIIPWKPKASYIVFGYIAPVLALILYIAVVVWVFLRYGKEPNTSKVIVTEFDVPDQLSPLEVSAVLKQKVESTAVSSHILFLATLGCIKIIQKNPEGMFQSLQKPAYTFEVVRQLPAVGESLQKHVVSCVDEIVFEMIFGDRSAAVGTQAALLDCRPQIVKHIVPLRKAVFDAVIQRGYFRRSPEKARNIGFTIHSLSFVGAIILAILLFGEGLGGAWVVLPIAPFIGFFFAPFMGQRTKTGAEVYRQLKGYQKYLAVAEKSRIEFFNDPKKYQQLFESVLPFAMVLGVEEKWAKHFEGLYATQPEWYSGSDPFTPLLFVSHMQQLQTVTQAIAAPSNGGSGGGGFSGGGFGGGGGGSW